MNANGISYASNAWGESRCAAIATLYDSLKTDTSMSGCRKLAELVRRATTLYSYQDIRSLVDDISCVIAQARGPLTWLSAGDFDDLGKGGYHPDYDDGTSQEFHFWAYFNSVTQGGLAGNIGVNFANASHECIGLTGGFPFVGTDWRGSTIEDVRLTFVAVGMGRLAHDGHISVDQLATAIERTLCEGSGDFPIDDSDLGKFAPDSYQKIFCLYNLTGKLYE